MFVWEVVDKQLDVIERTLRIPDDTVPDMTGFVTEECLGPVVVPSHRLRLMNDVHTTSASFR